MKKKIILITAVLFAALALTACKSDTSINVNVEPSSSISGTVFGKSALVEIGNKLWYDTTTGIVYWWNGCLNSQSSTTPTPYYAPNGLPYRYNPETNTFEEIQRQ